METFTKDQIGKEFTGSSTTQWSTTVGKTLILINIINTINTRGLFQQNRVEEGRRPLYWHLYYDEVVQINTNPITPDDIRKQLLTL